MAIDINIDIRERRSAARNAYSACAGAVTRFAGSPTATVLAFGIVGGWATYGVLHHFPDRWVSALGVVTGSITFIKVFLIQHAARRDARAAQLKLDAILRAIDARPDLVNLEQQPLCEQERIERDLLGDLRPDDDGACAEPACGSSGGSNGGLVDGFPGRPGGPRRDGRGLSPVS